MSLLSVTSVNRSSFMSSIKSGTSISREFLDISKAFKRVSYSTLKVFIIEVQTLLLIFKKPISYFKMVFCFLSIFKPNSFWDRFKPCLRFLRARPKVFNFFKSI